MQSAASDWAASRLAVAIEQVGGRPAGRGRADAERSGHRAGHDGDAAISVLIERLQVAVTYDPAKGYMGAVPRLLPVAALSLSGTMPGLKVS